MKKLLLFVLAILNICYLNSTDIDIDALEQDWDKLEAVRLPWIQNISGYSIILILKDAEDNTILKTPVIEHGNQYATAISPKEFAAMQYCLFILTKNKSENEIHILVDITNIKTDFTYQHIKSVGISPNSFDLFFDFADIKTIRTPYEISLKEKNIKITPNALQKTFLPEQLFTLKQPRPSTIAPELLKTKPSAGDSKSSDVASPAAKVKDSRLKCRPDLSLEGLEVLEVPKGMSMEELNKLAREGLI